MNSHKKPFLRWTSLFSLVVALGIFAAPQAQALTGQLGILDLSANDGINPATGRPWQAGDQYRLVFITSERHDATAWTDINIYNDWVTSVAHKSTAFDLSGSRWYVIGSTESRFDENDKLLPGTGVDARTNTATDPDIYGDGHSIYSLDSKLVARDFRELWSGEIQNGIVVTELGTKQGGFPATGTLANGRSREISRSAPTFDALGGNNPGQGNADRNDHWIYRAWTSSTDPQTVYAMSAPLTIISGEYNDIPEASAALLIGLAGLALLRRRRG